MCIVCSGKLTGRQRKFCSLECKQKNHLKVQAAYRRAVRGNKYKVKKQPEKMLIEIWKNQRIFLMISEIL